MSKKKKGKAKRPVKKKKPAKKTVAKKTAPLRSQKVILEVLSNHEAAEEKRRIPRLQLSSCQFRLKQNGKIYSVHDLSDEGMALTLLEEQDLLLFPIGTQLWGTLNLKGEKCTVKMQVIYVHRNVIGCRFSEATDEFKAALSRCLDPKVLGKELKRIPSLETKSVWYHSKTGCDLIFFGAESTDVKRIQKVLCCVLGHFVQWDKAVGVSTGTTRSAHNIPESWGLLSYETMVLSLDPAPDSEKLSIAKKVVLSSNLDTDLKDWCLKQFRG
jgi:hypothetical protein